MGESPEASLCISFDRIYINICIIIIANFVRISCDYILIMLI